MHLYIYIYIYIFAIMQELICLAILSILEKSLVYRM